MTSKIWLTMWALSTAGVAAAADQAPLMLNDASVEQLASLDHVDMQDAQAIVALRSERGRLSSVEALRVLGTVDEPALASLRRSTAVELELPTAPSASYNTVEDVLAAFNGEPTVQDVQGWVMTYTNTHADAVRGWMAASKNFALLPELRLEYKVKDGWDQDWEYYPADGVIDSIDDQEEVFDILDDAGRDRDTTYVARATWDLDKLVMSSERIRVINEAQDIVKLRDKVLSEATAVYFERRQVQVQMLLEPKGDLRGQVKDQLRLMELTAQLDALSGGAFSAGL